MRSDPSRPLPGTQVARLLSIALALAILPATAVAQWTRVTDPGTFDGIEVFLPGHDAFDDVLFVGTFEGLVYGSVDHGDSWSLVGEGLVQQYDPVAEMALVDDRLIISRSASQGNYRCRHDGETWTEWEPIASQDGILRSLSVMGSTLYASLGGSIHRSDDDGSSWTPVTAPTLQPVQELFVSDGRLYASEQVVGSGQLYRSDDGGATWTGIGATLGSSYVATHLVFQARLYLSLYHGGGLGTVWSSADHGDTWEPVTGLPTDDNINGMALTATGVAIGASSANPAGQSLFVSSDFASWEDDTGDLSIFARPVNELVSHDGWLFKSGGTVAKWRAPHPASSAVAATAGTPGAALALDARPNPFNPAVRIHYQVARRAHVRLTIHDVRGRLVATLVDGAVDPGARIVRWDGRDAGGRAVGSGTYFVHLVDGLDVRSSKIVLAR